MVGGVAEANPIKQGLKLYSQPIMPYKRNVAEANPIKQGLKLMFILFK